MEFMHGRFLEVQRGLKSHSPLQGGATAELNGGRKWLVFFISSKPINNARPPVPLTCPKAFSNLINRCWSSNPGKRPHFDEIVSILEGYLESLEQDP